MYKFKKVAGLMLDQQDDPGAGWELLSEFWPPELEPPTHGQEINKSACAIGLTDGIDKLARYPVDTPSNALASSMYFLAFGLDAIEDPNDALKIAHDLQEYRIAHGVSLPEDFVAFLKQAEVDEPEEVYADYEENLPVTTPEQTQASIDLFTKHADKWSASDRMLYSARLEKAAAYYGIDAELPYATTEMSKHASGAIDLRLRIMDEVTRGVESEDFSEYYDGMEVIKEAMSDVREYEDILKIAQAIEDLDKDFGMDEAWGVQVPDPVDSITEGFNADPFSEVDKKAQTDWDSVNWEELPFEDDVVDAIKSDPETIIPTLPMAQRNIVEDHING